MSPKKSGVNSAFAAFGRLSGRERMLIGVTVLVGVVFAFVGGTLFVQRRLDRAQKRLVERRADLRDIEGLESLFKNAQRERSSQKRSVERNNIQLFSFLPKVAAELGLTLNDLVERKTPLKDSGIDEISVDVNLRQMSIDKLDAFLEKVEGAGSGGLVKVLKIKVKTRFDNAELLDVTMKVATYKASSSS